jgi:hypothetical protein
MTTAFIAVSLTLAVNAFGLGHPALDNWDYAERHRSPHHTDFILPPGPGDGWGFPNDRPELAGWFDPGVYLPLGADRTADYFFPRFLSVPPEQMFLQTFYNPFETRGQRYVPYVAAGGDHPAGGAPISSAALPVNPYADVDDDRPVTPVPRLKGKVEATPLSSSESLLTPH